MTATIHPLHAEPPDPFADLRTDRAKIEAELQRFAIVDERRNGAEAKIAEVDRALAQLDAGERRAIETWAESADGEPPAPLLDERKALLARRLDAEAERQAADIAVEAVAAKRTGLLVEMNRIGARMRERQVAAALEEGRRLHVEAVALAADVGVRMMRLEALRQALTEAQAEAAGRRDDALAAIFNAAWV